jgi:Na+/H+ antiporter NhaD/arsenite permease-like protein
VHPDPQTVTVVAVFAVVYLGMILGALPFLQLDRTGIALLGGIVLIGTDVLDIEEAWEAIHVPTLILLFAFMVLSAQLRLGGFYTWVTRTVGGFQQRHHLPGDGAGAGGSLSCAPAQSGAVPARACLQC